MGGPGAVANGANGGAAPLLAFPAWARSVHDCLAAFAVDQDLGLSELEAARRRARYGRNELEKEPPKPMWKLVLEQFEDTLVRILLVAALVSFVLAYMDGDDASDGGITAYVEPLVILLILILNAVVGVWQESNAERALEALKEMQSEHAKVVRDGKYIPDLPASELVPGDIVKLVVGDKVPADMRILQLKTSTLRLEQSSLTGESHAVNKSYHEVDSEDCELQAKDCMVFAGTTLVNGACINLVIATGMRTEFGKIQACIQEAALEDDDTPLKKKLDEFGDRLTLVIGIICLLVWVINYKYFLSWEMIGGVPRNIKFSFEKCTYYFKIAVALAVAAIPEGLPAVITTCLALGTRKMAQKNAIVRKLPSVETLGCTTVICSDKTGTLTTNQMSVTNVIANGKAPEQLRCYNVEGTTYSPSDGGIVGWPTQRSLMDANFQTLAGIMAVCNDAGINHKGGVYKATGMPTEAALKVLVEKMGLPDDRKFAAIMAAREEDPGSSLALSGCSDAWTASMKRLAMLEFDRARKSMSVIVQISSGGNRLLVKGAVENILERCSQMQLADGSVVPLPQDARQAIVDKLNDMTSRALRCLAMAFSDDLGELQDYSGEHHRGHKLLLNPANYADIESNLVYVGMVGLRDPPREEVQEAINDCRDAGIRVMVITGDNKNTAEAICREIGVFTETDDVSSMSYTGRDFLALTLEQRRAFLRGTGGRVFSRAEPRHKQDIVRLLKESGEVVAMTGDGVNDAPALKLADIGIAMGIAGTEARPSSNYLHHIKPWQEMLCVAKEAADMVLADDNFSTIVAAVAEGRSIYNNMKAFIRYMISSNMGEVASIFMTAALGMPEGLIPVQLLWVNLVTDGPPATALGFNPPDGDIMRNAPRRSDDRLINAWVFFRYVVIGLYVGLATVGVFAVWYTHNSFLGIDLSSDGHTLVTFSQLRNWSHCSEWEDFRPAPFSAGSRTFAFDKNPCDYFTTGKVKATTLSLSVLVAIEMFNSLNALSEDGSLLVMPPWVNPWLMLAMAVSFGLHFLILYVPVLANVFGIVPLTINEWLLVLAVSLPVILIDEALKFVGRWIHRKDRRLRKIKAE
eukprot:SM000055S18212  [mRNA]  locus=s55:21353:28368:+ [translate_table: standard]